MLCGQAKRTVFIKHTFFCTIRKTEGLVQDSTVFMISRDNTVLYSAC